MSENIGWRDARQNANVDRVSLMRNMEDLVVMCLVTIGAVSIASWCRMYRFHMQQCLLEDSDSPLLSNLSSQRMD